MTLSFESALEIAAQRLQAFHANASAQSSPAINQPPMTDLIEDMNLEKMLEDGNLTEHSLSNFLKSYLSGLTPVYHPGNIAHQQAVPHPMSAVAGLLDSYVNSDGSTYELGPSSVSLEYFLINWLIEKIGWTTAPIPPVMSTKESFAGGVLLQGGSISNLTAMIAARTHCAPDVWRIGNPDNLVILAPEETHYSIARAAGIMGLGHQSVIPLEIDAKGTIKVDRIPNTVKNLRASGKTPMALIANAANTAAGMYDSFLPIGEYCNEQNIWFHIDGAHGGPALLTTRYAHLMDGVELCDSITMNMHKLMRIPSTCTALIMRDSNTLDQAFEQKASYLFFDKEQPGIDFLNRTIECTKPALGLKFFLMLAAEGEIGVSRYIEDLFKLTLSSYEYLQAQPDFQCPHPPQSNILCFKMRNFPDQLKLRSALLKRGHFYISTATLDGVRYLRFTLTNPETRIDHIQQLVAELREIRDGYI